MKNSRGLTLIELMVTLAVFAIVTTLAFPGFRLYQQNSNRVTQINDLIATFNMARSEAVKRNLPVIVCASADQANCSNANDWTTGWIAVIDDNLNGVTEATDNDGQQSGGETAYYVHGRLSGANLFLADLGGATQIIFAANGTSVPAATFMRCDDRRNTDDAAIRNNHARAIILTTSGRTRLSRDSDNNGVQEDAANVDLNCP